MHPALTRSRRFATLFWILLLPATAPAWAQGESEDLEAVARSYLETLAAMDWEKQKSYYTEETIFEDPTAVYFGVPWKIVGGEAIADFWRSAATDAGTLEIRNEIGRLFVTGPYVVIDYASHVRMRGDMIGFPERELEGSIEVATVLKIQHGKILHHLDHADYASAWNELEAIKKRFEDEAAQAAAEAETDG